MEIGEVAVGGDSAGPDDGAIRLVGRGEDPVGGVAVANQAFGCSPILEFGGLGGQRVDKV